MVETAPLNVKRCTAHNRNGNQCPHVQLALLGRLPNVILVIRCLFDEILLFG
jgi:hypothetical protein